MRDERELRARAAQLKVKLVNRANRIGELVGAMAQSKAGLIKPINEERMKTMERELDHASNNQARDALMYATLRYALGIKKDILADQLDLQE